MILGYIFGNLHFRQSWVRDVNRVCFMTLFFPPARWGSQDFIRVASSSSSPSSPLLLFSSSPLLLFSSSPLLLFSSSPRPSAPQLRAPAQPRVPDLTGHCRTSARRQRECQIECQKERQNRCQIECQKECQRECHNVIYARMNAWKDAR